MLLAAGAVAIEQWLAMRRPTAQRWVRGATAVALTLSVLLTGLVTLPVAPINSALWDVAVAVNGEFAEMLGWPELAAEVARIYQTPSPEEQAQTGTMAKRARLCPL